MVEPIDRETIHCTVVNPEEYNLIHMDDSFLAIWDDGCCYLHYKNIIRHETKLERVLK